jgi:hypothetical protein
MHVHTQVLEVILTYSSEWVDAWSAYLTAEITMYKQQVCLVSSLQNSCVRVRVFAWLYTDSLKFMYARRRVPPCSDMHGICPGSLCAFFESFRYTLLVHGLVLSHHSYQNVHAHVAWATCVLRRIQQLVEFPYMQTGIITYTHTRTRTHTHTHTHTHRCFNA